MYFFIDVLKEEKKRFIVHYTKFRLTRFILAFILLVGPHTQFSGCGNTPFGSCLGHNLGKTIAVFCFWIGYNIHGRQTERWKVDFDKRKKWFEIGPWSYQTKQTSGFLVLCSAFLFTSLLGFKGVLCANWIFMEKK